MAKLRIASVQYPLCEVEDFEAFARNIRAYVASAADEGAKVICFPEYFSMPLLSMQPTLPAPKGLRSLATQFTAPLIELFSALAQESAATIIAGSHPTLVDDQIENHSWIFKADGRHCSQPKLHITPSEKNEWGIIPGSGLRIIETPEVKIAVQICYDIEFPRATQLLAEEGVDLVFVPYCTDDRAGHFRVSRCAQARAIENQIVVATAGLVGRLGAVTDMQDQYAQSAVYTPCDEGFPDAGVLALADEDCGSLLIADIDMGALSRLQKDGTVTPRMDRRDDLGRITSIT